MSEDEQNAEVGMWVKEHAAKNKEMACIERKLQRFFDAMRYARVNFKRGNFSYGEVHGNVHIGKSEIAWVDLHEIASLSNRAEQLEVTLDELEDKLRRAGAPVSPNT